MKKLSYFLFKTIALLDLFLLYVLHLSKLFFKKEEYKKAKESILLNHIGGKQTEESQKVWIYKNLWDWYIGKKTFLSESKFTLSRRNLPPFPVFTYQTASFLNITIRSEKDLRMILSYHRSRTGISKEEVLKSMRNKTTNFKNFGSTPLHAGECTLEQYLKERNINIDQAY